MCGSWTAIYLAKNWGHLPYQSCQSERNRPMSSSCATLYMFNHISKGKTWKKLTRIWILHWTLYFMIFHRDISWYFHHNTYSHQRSQMWTCISRLFNWSKWFVRCGVKSWITPFYHCADWKKHLEKAKVLPSQYGFRSIIPWSLKPFAWSSLSKLCLIDIIDRWKKTGWRLEGCPVA